MSLEDYIINLPNDLVIKIMSYLDIDSRRALNIIRKIKIPIQFTQQLSSLINNIDFYKNDSIITSYINLNSIYVIRHQTNNLFNYTTYYVEHTKKKNNYTNDTLFLSLQLPDIYISKENKNPDKYRIFYKT